MKDIIVNAYAQGGAILLMLCLLVAALIATFKYIVKPLWDDNKTLREKVMTANERTVAMGEASRATNENTSRVLSEQTIVFRELLTELRSRR